MCGIAGYIGHCPIAEPLASRTLGAMRNRGPDIQQSKIYSHGSRQIALLHSRLAIIDLDPRSNQPFTIGDIDLIFNGEIYNYVELRKGLESKGVVFHTSSDTEVLLQSYLHEGKRCVEKFEGMWAFAIFDRRNGELFLSRDPFGEKPLYYRWLDEPGGRGFYFGSEVKFIEALSGRTPTVNREQLLRYLVHGYKSLYKQPATYYNEIAEVPYGSNLTIDSQMSEHVFRYWTPSYAPREMSLAQAVEGVRQHFLDSIKIRLRADVPLAFCLSGGVDSGAIASTAAKCFGCNVKTFSLIDSDERYNELANIQATIDDLGCAHTVINIPRETSFGRLKELVAYHDAPVATITYYIHSLLSEEISRQGCRVVFSGTSADELFTGYYDHFNLHLHELRRHPLYPKLLEEWRAHTGKFVRNPYLQDPELYDKDQSFRGHIYLNSDEFASYLKIPFSEPFIEESFTDKSLLRNRMLNELFHEATPVILKEDDLNSMKYSIENRSPYLDRRLFEFVYSIPSEHLIRDGFGKYTLRAAMDGILNNQVRLDRQKKGFNASIQSVFDLGHSMLREELLDNSEIYELVDRRPIEKLLAEDKPLPNSFSKFLFSFISAKFFLDERSRRSKQIWR